MILHGIEYQRPTSLNMRILADHVTYSFLAFMKSIFHFCLGCYCGGYSQNGRSNLSSCDKSRMPLDLYIKLRPYKFSLQASVDYHGYSMNSGHYTASINCCGKTFHCNDNKITECNIKDTYNSSTAYILLYKLIIEC